MLADAFIRTNYVSRLLELPPLVAQAAFDDLVSVTTDPLQYTADGERARLMLRAPVEQLSGPGYRAFRCHRAVILAGWHRWPVELELLPWSAARVELGLRPLGVVSGRVPPSRITRSGHELLAVLAAALHAWADQPLADWAGVDGPMANSAELSAGRAREK